MLTAAHRTLRTGLASARMQIEQWRERLLDDRRLRDGSLRMNSETWATLKPWERVLERLEAAEQALAAMLPARDRRIIRRGLRAGLMLATIYRLADLKSGRQVRHVDRAIAKIRAAMAVIAPLPAPTGASEELPGLVAGASPQGA